MTSDSTGQTPSKSAISQSTLGTDDEIQVEIGLVKDFCSGPVCDCDGLDSPEHRRTIAGAEGGGRHSRNAGRTKSEWVVGWRRNTHLEFFGVYLACRQCIGKPGSRFRFCGQDGDGDLLHRYPVIPRRRAGLACSLDKPSLKAGASEEIGVDGPLALEQTLSTNRERLHPETSGDLCSSFS